MMPIPRSALLLGLAGLIPFLVSLGSQLFPDLAAALASTLGPRFVGPYMALAYGTIIFSFMSGVLWGFATKAKRQIAVGYALSVIPALWAFFLVGNGPVSSAIWLALGFVLLIALDFMFWQRGLAPPWWMRLRLMLTAIVVASLALTVYWSA